MVLGNKSYNFLIVGGVILIILFIFNVFMRKENFRNFEDAYTDKSCPLGDINGNDIKRNIGQFERLWMIRYIASCNNAGGCPVFTPKGTGYSGKCFNKKKEKIDSKGFGTTHRR